MSRRIATDRSPQREACARFELPTASAAWLCLPLRAPFARRLACALAALLLAGCGLLPPPPIGFRSYPLRDVTLTEASEVVDTVTRRIALERWGGVGLTWSDGNTRLVVDPIYDGQRRLRLHLELSALGADVDVQIFALVEHLQLGGARVGWTQPMQDVPLEELLYEEFVAELVARRAGAAPAGSAP